MTLTAAALDQDDGFSFEDLIYRYLRSIHPDWQKTRKRLLANPNGENVNLREAVEGDLENPTLKLRAETQCAPGNSNRGIQCSWTHLKWERSTADFQFFGFPRLGKILVIETKRLKEELKSFGAKKDTSRDHELLAHWLLERWGATVILWDDVVKLQHA